MQILQQPFIIISALALIFLLLVIGGLYFTMKSVNTASGITEKSYCGIGKIEYDFDKMKKSRKNRCLVYISVSLDSVKKLYSDGKTVKLYEQIRKIILRNFCFGADGEVSLYGQYNFIAINSNTGEEITSRIDTCFGEIYKVLTKYSVLHLARVNFGYYLTTSTEVSFKTATERAKQACSIAKDKDILYCRWDNSSGMKFEKKIKIENSIKNEIESNKFFLEYQPIIDAEEEKIIGAEVLSRLNSATEGIITPHYFLSAVNNVGLNEEFDYYIFEKNCKWISAEKGRSDYVYTINFSRSTLCDESLADNIIEIVEKYGVSYSCIAIEILEDKDISEEEKNILIGNITRLKEKGVMIFLDDFGKGYASYEDLTQFDISVVKIDKSITQSAITPSGFTVLKNIIKTAHDLGFKALCEGIENEELKNRVKEAGCDFLQGYYFHYPMPATELERLLKKQ